MAIGLTSYLEGKIIDGWFRGQAVTMPATVYVGLHTTKPTLKDGSDAVEVTGGAYARQAVTYGAATSDVTGSTASNTTEVVFPDATADWGNAKGFAIYDAATLGNMLAAGDLPTAKDILSGDTARFAAGTLTVKLS